MPPGDSVIARLDCILNEGNIESNNMQLELTLYCKRMFTLFMFTFAKRRAQCTKIFTGNASLFARWQQVLMPRTEHFEHKPVRSLSLWTAIGNSNKYFLFTPLFLTVYVDLQLRANAWVMYERWNKAIVLYRATKLAILLSRGGHDLCLLSVGEYWLGSSTDVGMFFRC